MPPGGVTLFHRCVAILADRFATAVPVMAREDAVQRTLELVVCAAECLVKIWRMLRHGHRFMARDARFHHAVLVAPTTFVAVLVTQVHLDPRHVGRKTVQRLPDLLTGPALESIVVLDPVAGFT